MTDKFKKLDISLGCILTCIYFIALPLTITTNSGGSSFLKVLTIPIAAYLLASMVFYKGKIEFNSVHLFSGLYLITALVTLFVDHGDVSMTLVRGYIETMALLFLMTIRSYSRNEIELLEITQLVLLAVLIWLGFIGADWYGDRNTMTLFGSTCDPNYFSGMFLFPISVAMKKCRENKIYMAVCPVLIVLGAYIVVTSGSRGGLLALAVMVLSFVFFYTKSLKQRVLGFAAAAVIAVILWTIIIPVLPEDVSARFSVEEVIESRGTSRIDIWISMLSEMKNSTWELFLGRGFNTYHELMIKGKLVRVVAHNQFIQSIYSQGLLGFFSFLFMSTSAVYRNRKKRGYVSAAMLGMLALSMSLSINPNIKEFWNLLIYSAFTLNLTGNQKEVDSI